MKRHNKTNVMNRHMIHPLLLLVVGVFYDCSTVFSTTIRRICCDCYDHRIDSSTRIEPRQQQHSTAITMMKNKMTSAMLLADSRKSTLLLCFSWMLPLHVLLKIRRNGPKPPHQPVCCNIHDGMTLLEKSHNDPKDQATILIHRHQKQATTHKFCRKTNHRSNNNDHKSDASMLPLRHGVTRKLLLQRSNLLLLLLVSSCTTPISPTSATDTIPSSNIQNSPSNNYDMNQLIIDLFHEIPTYTIVDDEGVPYMVVGEDAKVTGYFFMEYQEAVRILSAATRSTDRSILEVKESGETASYEPDQLINPWKQARISTVPLDFAITLCYKSNTKEVGVGNFYQIAPSESDVEDALEITGQASLAEGKVPLFYAADFTNDNNNKTLLYFHRSQLEQDYKRSKQSQSSSSSSSPNVQVSELFAILKQILTTTLTSNNDDSSSSESIASSITFVPPIGSIKQSNEIMKNSKNRPPFTLGKRNLIL